MEYTKFRGKCINTEFFDNYGWVYGDLITQNRQTRIRRYRDFGYDEFPVQKETVGQLRATKSDGTDVFEGDILVRQGYWAMVVEHYRVYPLDKVQRFNSRGVPIDEFDFDMWTVAGTIHDDAGDRP